MSRRILQDQGRALNQTLANLDNFYQRVGKPVNVYKFRKVSGMIKMTNLGEQTLKYPNSKYQQTTNVYTGKEPVVVVWEGSTIAEGKDLRIIKHVKVGTYYEMYSTGANVNTLETTTLSLLGKEYVNTVIDRDITLQSNTWLPTSDDMTEFVYLILDPINQSQQWLEISSCTPIFNEETKKFQYSEINFNNINLKYSTTGKTLLDFIQFGGIGEGYCFPVETTNDKGEVVVSLDKDKLLLNGKGTNQFQFDFNSGAGNSDFLIFGRKKETMNEDGTIEMEAPHMLWLWKANFPKSSPFFYTTPNLNSYAMINTQPTKQGIWASYKDAYKGNDRIGEYNILNTKEVMTGFKHDEATVRKTNPNVSTYINWDNKKHLRFTQLFWMLANPYFKSSNLIVSRNVSYCEFFNINAMINFYTDVINYEYLETTRYKLTDTFGILGSVVNLIVGGLNIGWTSTITLAPTQPINLLVPCISFEDGKSALAATAPLPTDIFIDDKAQTVLPTSTKILTSWNFSLTDRCIDISQSRPDAPLGKGRNGVWDLKYLGQTKFEDGTWINIDRQPFKVNLDVAIPSTPSVANQEWIIDYVVFHSVANCDMRISAYSSDGESIYSMFMETNGKARKEPVIWNNRIKFNYYDEFNTIGHVSWPENIEEAKPDIANLSVPLESINGVNILDFRNELLLERDFREHTNNFGNKIQNLDVGAYKNNWTSNDGIFLKASMRYSTQLIPQIPLALIVWEQDGITPFNEGTINFKGTFNFFGSGVITIQETKTVPIRDYEKFVFSCDGGFTYHTILIADIPETGEWFSVEFEESLLNKWFMDFFRINDNNTIYQVKQGSWNYGETAYALQSFLTSETKLNSEGKYDFLPFKFTLKIRFINESLEIQTEGGTYFKNLKWSASAGITNPIGASYGREGGIRIQFNDDAFEYNFLSIDKAFLIPKPLSLKKQ